MKPVTKRTDARLFSYEDMLRFSRYALGMGPSTHDVKHLFQHWFDGPTPGTDRPATSWVKPKMRLIGSLTPLISFDLYSSENTLILRDVDGVPIASINLNNLNKESLNARGS